MNKVDTIKLRVTPDFKARVQREAAYRQTSVSELVVAALEGEMHEPREVVRRQDHAATDGSRAEGGVTPDEGQRVRSVDEVGGATQRGKLEGAGVAPSSVRFGEDYAPWKRA